MPPIGAAVWAVVVPLATLHMGGATTGRLATVRDPAAAYMHGALVWALSLLRATWMLGTGASRVIGGSLHLAGNLTDSALSAGGQVTGRSDATPSRIEGSVALVRNSAAQRGVTGLDV